MQAVASGSLDAYYPPAMLGKVVDERYQLVRLLGTGGMGNVYEAVHQGTGRRVAVKVIANTELASDSGAVTRFQREAKAAGSVETPHIAQVLDAGTDRATGMPFIAMEFLVGDDLKELSAQLGALDAHLALSIVAQACAGLQRAHESGIVHRDIKPANIFLAHQPDGRVVVKVLDFGIAKLPSKLLAGGDAISATTTGRLLGSPLFMSPEQVRGLKSLDHRTDIWSLGAVLYQALAGRPPFAECETVGQLLVAICSQRPPQLDQIAPWVRPEAVAVVDRALALDADDRYPTARAMLEAITLLLPGGNEIDTSKLISASGKQMPMPSSDKAAGAGTQSLDDNERFVEKASSPGVSSALSQRRAASAESSDSTLPSANDGSLPPNAVISHGQDLARRRGGRWLLPSLVLLSGLALAAAVWLTQRGDGSNAAVKLEPTLRVSEAPSPTNLESKPQQEMPVAIDPPTTKVEAGTSGDTVAQARSNSSTKEPRRKPAPLTGSSTAPPVTAPPFVSAAVIASPPPAGTLAAPGAANPAPPSASAEPTSAPSRWKLERDFPLKKAPQ